MDSTYDIDLLTAYTLQYLTAQYPITPKKPLKWSTKVRIPTIRWTKLPQGWYGACNWAHKGLVIELSSTKCYTEQELVATIVHEYRHLMQPSALYYWYSRRDRHSYERHPLEIDAIAFETAVTEAVLSTRYSRCEAP